MPSEPTQNAMTKYSKRPWHTFAVNPNREQRLSNTDILLHPKPCGRLTHTCGQRRNTSRDHQEVSSTAPLPQQWHKPAVMK